MADGRAEAEEPAAVAEATGGRRSRRPGRRSRRRRPAGSSVVFRNPLSRSAVPVRAEDPAAVEGPRPAGEVGARARPSSRRRPAAVTTDRNGATPLPSSRSIGLTFDLRAGLSGSRGRAAARPRSAGLVPRRAEPGRFEEPGPDRHVERLARQRARRSARGAGSSCSSSATPRPARTVACRRSPGSGRSSRPRSAPLWSGPSIFGFRK